MHRIYKLFLFAGSAIILLILVPLGNIASDKKVKENTSIKGITAPQTEIPYKTIHPTQTSTQDVLKPVPSQKPTQEHTVSKTKPVTKPKTSEYSCDCGKTCPNLSCSEAQFQLNECGCLARDADKDGIACDAQCR